MRLRTFTARDMPTAMQQVRDALGDNAIILSSETDRGRGIRITAAVEETDENSLTPLPQTVGSLRKSAQKAAVAQMPKNDPAADYLRFELQNILRFHNLPELFIAKILQKAGDAEFASVLSLHSASPERSPARLYQLGLEKLLGAYFTFAPLQFPSPLEGEGGASRRVRGSADMETSRNNSSPNPSLKGRGNRIMLAGAPGVGKTLTIAKLATKLAMEKQPMAVFTTDNKRAGGVEQLQAFTSILGLPLVVAASGNELRQHLQTLPAATCALIDTAGCNPYNATDLGELHDYAFLPGVEPLLALPAGGDSAEAIDAVEAFAAVLPVKRVLITHADMARRFGGVLAAAAAHGLTFSNAGASAGVIDALQPLDSALLAQLLLRYQLQSEQT